MGTKRKDARLKKAKKKKGDVNLVHWLRQKLRRISYQFPARKEAIVKARVSRGLYRCAKCEGTFKHGEFQLDHIEEVDNPHTGFIGWDDYISRLFVGVEGWQILCLGCHAVKTSFAQEIRKQVKQDKKRETPEEDI